MSTTDQKSDMQTVIESSDINDALNRIRALNIPKGKHIYITLKTDEPILDSKIDDSFQALLNIKPRKGKFDSTDLIRQEREKLDTRNIVKTK